MSLQVHNPTIAEQKRMVLEVLKGKFFDQNDFDLNLMFIRNDLEEKSEYTGENEETLVLHDNLFNDGVVLSWLENGEWQKLSYPATTDPGFRWRQSPGRSGGVGAVREGFWPQSHELGYHGEREALVQTGTPLQVYRDNDRDKVLVLNPSTAEKGWGFNIHYMGNHYPNVNSWSGGCMGSNNPEFIENLVRLTKKQRDVGLGSKISMSLVRHSWFEDLELAKEDFTLIQGLELE